MPMPTDRNTDFSILYAMLAILVIICVNVLSKCVVQPMMNDVSQKMELQELETAFNTVQHPDQTGCSQAKARAVTSSSAKSAVMAGNGIKSLPPMPVKR
jgi:hypothetical protein